MVLRRCQAVERIDEVENDRILFAWERPLNPPNLLFHLVVRSHRTRQEEPVEPPDIQPLISKFRGEKNICLPLIHGRNRCVTLLLGAS